MNKKDRIQFRLPHIIMEKLKKEADKKFMNVSEIIRHIILKYFEDKNEK